MFLPHSILIKGQNKYNLLHKKGISSFTQKKEFSLQISKTIKNDLRKIK
jgi:hypothetical protein